jgi:predicted esterase
VLGVPLAVATLSVCAWSGNASASATNRPVRSPVVTTGQPRAVGLTSMTFVDHRRRTPANGSVPGKSSRLLVTTVLYPASGDATSSTPRPDATPDRTGAPYPLVVFAHGLGASPDLYLPLLERWAAAGFVVAAPTFPLTNDATAGGPNAGDVVHQPADMTFVITSVLRASHRPHGRLAGMVDEDHIAVAGHSNGAITTLGIAANSCCRDPRVEAAVVMAGTDEHYPHGHYDFSRAAPLLIVHGTDDSFVPYTEGVKVFNLARGPKAILTIEHGEHGAAAALTGPADVVVHTTIDFLDRYVRRDPHAARRLVDDARSSDTALRYVPRPGSTTTMPTVPAPETHLHASVTPRKRLQGGQAVTITWSGYTPGKVINILQCSGDDEDLSNQGACDFSHAALLHPDPTGSGSVDLQIVEGKVGTGTCDATHQGCFIVVNNASSPDPSASLKLPITFAP